MKLRKIVKAMKAMKGVKRGTRMSSFVFVEMSERFMFRFPPSCLEWEQPGSDMSKARC